MAFVLPDSVKPLHPIWAGLPGIRQTDRGGLAPECPVAACSRDPLPTDTPQAGKIPAGNAIRRNRLPTMQVVQFCDRLDAQK